MLGCAGLGAARQCIYEAHPGAAQGTHFVGLEGRALGRHFCDPLKIHVAGTGTQQKQAAADHKLGFLNIHFGLRCPSI